MTLQVKLWGPHATAFDKIGEGEIVELKNVHIKMDRSGTHLEGALHEDRHYPHRVNVVSMQNKYRDPRVYELERRKETHMMAVRSREQRGMVKQSRKTTRLADIENNERRLYKTPSGVECELPFVNAMYKSRVRVVDFWPENLEDFSKSLDNPEFNDVHEEDQTQSSTTYTALSTGTQRWEWHFCLLVEDAKHPPGAKSPVRIPLLVFDKDAECLLCLDATDCNSLRKDERTLNQLREKLFILWGNLHELKSREGDLLDEAVISQHSSKAFDCCIKETGAATGPEPGMVGAEMEPSYQRIYHIHGTTIRG
ncbi:Protection of telomeres protein 1 [Diplodia seriata]|uniref:Protection of telomeres protein 1 n=1 Tax=Diplodia seriata TaxID=420778 RepID=A0A1S8B6R2_9PEZI|nr:Protection of telomeres protein 1 [Diplodia seriata]